MKSVTRFTVAMLLMAAPIVYSADLAGLGTITFPTSASGPAQDHFLRGVTIMHSFGWKEARAEFQAAQQLDPDFALAYWGEALCYNHPLISEWDPETPKDVLRRLGDTPEARLAKAPTHREKGFIRAVEALFLGDGDTRTRRRAYMEVMRELHEAYPEDEEVTAFYALSLLMSAGWGDEAMRTNVLAGAVALQLLDRNPNHPGAAHYTIHAFDDPVHAPLALPAAQVFARIAEKVSHARHMPSHIFIQRGMWDQVSSSNQSAYEAAVESYEPGDRLDDMVHALDWGQYGDLQRGDYARAAGWIEIMEGIAERAPDNDLAAMRLAGVKARYAIEREDWQGEPVTDRTSPTQLLAFGLGAVHTGDFELAEAVVEKLAEKAEEAASKDDYRFYYSFTAKPLKIMSREVAGLLEIARGNTEAGLALLSEGVDIDESRHPPIGAPSPLKPAHELYGEALLAAGRPEEALAMFERSLERMPNRPLSLRGLARAHVALGNAEDARSAYARLESGWQGRDVAWRQEAAGHVAGTGASE